MGQGRNLIRRQLSVSTPLSSQKVFLVVTESIDTIHHYLSDHKNDISSDRKLVSGFDPFAKGSNQQRS